MKRFTIFLALLSSIAFGQLPENEKQYSAHENLLDNAGFENSVTKWTVAGGTLVTDSSPVAKGDRSALWTPTTSAQTVTSNPKAVPEGIQGGSCYGSIKIHNAVAGDYEFKIQDGAAGDLITALAVPTNTGWQKLAAGFPCPASGNVVLKVETLTGSPAAINLDDAWLGTDYRIGETAPIVTDWAQCISIESNIIVGSGTEECNYRRVGNSMEFRAIWIDADWDSVGSFTISPPNGLTIDYSAAPIQDRILYGTALAFDSSENKSVVGVLRGTASTNVAYVAGANLSTGVWSGSASFPFNWQNALDRFSVEGSFPILEWKNQGTSKTVTLDTQNWFVDASIGGVNSNQRITDSNAGVFDAATWDLVLNTGSENAEITCTSGNAPSGLTCSAGNESTGIAFTPPFLGKYLVCVSGVLVMAGDAGDGVNNIHSIVETGLTDETPISMGAAKSATGGDTNAVAVRGGLSMCDVLTVTSLTKKAVKLFTAVNVANTPTNNRILADRNTGVDGDRDLNFKVIPISQNFPQAVALTGPTSEVMVNSHTTGYGSTSTTTVLYDTTQINVGNNISISNSATDGTTFTINKDGVYSCFARGRTSSGPASVFMAITRNESGSAAPSSSSPEKVIASITVISSDHFSTSGTQRLSEGDILRVQITSSPSLYASNLNYVNFRCTELNATQ